MSILWYCTHYGNGYKLLLLTYVQIIIPFFFICLRLAQFRKCPEYEKVEMIIPFFSRGFDLRFPEMEKVGFFFGLENRDLEKV